MYNHIAAVVLSCGEIDLSTRVWVHNYIIVFEKLWPSNYSVVYEFITIWIDDRWIRYEEYVIFRRPSVIAQVASRTMAHRTYRFIFFIGLLPLLLWRRENFMKTER